MWAWVVVEKVGFGFGDILLIGRGGGRVEGCAADFEI